MAIKRSQQNYSRPRAEVEQFVIDSHAPEERLKTAVENGNGNKGGFTKPSAFHKIGTDKGFIKQKEQLKNGGSIKRGPAQTPPGTGAKKPEQKNDTAQADEKPKVNQSDRNNEQPRKSRLPEKSSEDLRAILAGMTAGTSSATKVEQTKETEIPRHHKKEHQQQDTKTQATKPAANATVSSSKEEQFARSKTNQKREVRSETKPVEKKESRNQTVQKNTLETNKDDLKSVLAELVAETAAAPKSEVVHTNVPPKEVTSAPTPRLQTEPDNSQKRQSEHLTQNPQPESTSQLHTQPRPQPQLHQPPVEQPKEPAPAQSLSPEVKQSDYTQIGGARQPAFTPVAQVEQPDISKVKQMLRTSGKERPPGV